MDSKHPHYKPVWDEYLFDMICRDADKYWAEWRKRRNLYADGTKGKSNNNAD